MAGSPHDIDHVTVASRDLSRLQRAFEAVGLPPEYGGPHSNGATHMSLLGFPDGTYVELISTVEGVDESPLWNRHVRENGGPCAWAVTVDDAAAAAERMREAGIAVEGPTHYTRERPDGEVIEWDLVFLGEGEPGSTLPFLIADRTPRELRIRPTDAVIESELTGVETVIVGVDDLDAAVEQFRRAFGAGDPAVDAGAEATARPSFGGRTATLSDAPVVLAEPLAGSWLEERLNRFGPSPCGYLLGTEDFEASRERFGFAETAQWDDRRIGWPETDVPELQRVGVVDD